MSAPKGGEPCEERDHANHSAPIPVSPAKMALVPDQLANEPLDILVEGKKVAEGEVVIVDGNFGVQITNIGSRRETLEKLKS